MAAGIGPAPDIARQVFQRYFIVGHGSNGQVTRAM